jgi:hypothetical protein
MNSYAVLWDFVGEESRPVGIAIHRGNDVYVDVADEYGIPKRYSAPYRVLRADSTEVVYRTQDAGYFEQLLLDLSRVFAIGERGEVASADSTTIMRLLTEKVHRPRNRARVGEYSGRIVTIAAAGATTGRDTIYAPARDVRIAARADTASAA